jgi:hypothetical protein
MNHLHKLRITPLTIVLEMHDGFPLEGFSGDTVRRMLENRFKQIDITRKKAGEVGKAFFRSDTVRTITNNKATEPKKTVTPPRGYAIAVTIDEPEKLSVHISLFGYFREAMPFLLPQLQHMFETQFGNTLSISIILDSYGRPIQRGVPIHEISLAEMEQARLEHNRLGLQFITPCLLYHRQNFDGQMRFPDIIKKLERRAQLISHFYCDGPEPDNVVISTEAEQVKVSEIHLKWHFQKPPDKNYSLMGYTGYVDYVADPGLLQHYLPLFLLGQWLQVGEKTNFGAGKYQVDHGHYTFV